MSPERLKRFFVKVDAGYQIARPVRDRCVFAVHNLASDPPFSRMDLVSCRNLLIYLGAGLQQRVMNTLFYALQPNGFLLLGSAETPGSLAEYFAPLDSQRQDLYAEAVAERRGFELPAHVATFPVFKTGEFACRLDRERRRAAARSTAEAGGSFAAGPDTRRLRW